MARKRLFVIPMLRKLVGAFCLHEDNKIAAEAVILIFMCLFFEAKVKNKTKYCNF